MKANHSSNNIENIHFSLTSNDFLDLIKLYVPLEKKGIFFSGNCPFCNEKEESFSAYEHKKSWHCYSCRQVGNIYDFIEKAGDLSSDEAIKFINSFINKDPQTRVHYLYTKTSKAKVVSLSEVDLKKDNILELDITEFIKPETINQPITQTTSETVEATIEKTTQENSITVKTENFCFDKECFNNSFIENLLANFHEHHEIAVVHRRINKIVGSSIENFSMESLLILNSFIKYSLEQSHDVLGDYDNNNPKIIFQMEVSIKDKNTKLIWLPIASKCQYNIIISSQTSSLEKVFIMKLKNYFNKLESS